MYKKIILYLTLLLNSFALSAQGIAYYDALSLDQTIRLNGKFSANSARTIIDYYFLTKGMTDDQVDSAVMTNPILAPYYKTGGIQGFLGSGSVFSSLGSTNVTNFADGVAKFLVERAKEELFIAFIQKFQGSIDSKYPELRVLFPNTTTLLNNFQSTEFSNILSTAREAFDKDLTNLLGSIVNLNDSLHVNASIYTNIPLAQSLTKVFDRPTGKIFLSAIAVANGFVANQKIPDVFATLTGPYLLGSYPDANFRDALQLLNILSFSIKNSAAGKSYLSLADLKKLGTTAQDTALRIYLGLVYQQIKNKKLFAGNAGFASFLNTFATNSAGLITYVDSLITQSTDVDAAISNLVAAKKKGEKDLSSYWSAIFASAGQLLTAVKNINVINSSIQFPAKLDSVFLYANQSLTIAGDIAVKNYNAAIVGTLTEISTIVGKADPSLTDALNNFVKYYSFAANVVAAKNSDDVKNAIEAVALPAGSYSIKRESIFNLSLNGYIGGYIGGEYLPALKEKQLAFSYGVSAPVGIAFSWGKLPCPNSINHGNQSFTIFIPIIDVGAMAAFRAQNDSSSYSSQVSLQNIISPGLYFYWGLGRCPMSIGLGGQLGPQLRSISAKDINIDKNYYLRFGLNVVMDIPFFDLYTRKN